MANERALFESLMAVILVVTITPHICSQVSGLRILERCRCGDNFCASFYTQPKPNGAYGAGHRNVLLEPAKGMLILDVVDNVIAKVEILDRNDIRPTLLAALP